MHVNETLHARIETIESGYEFLLAYAAQGRDDDRAPSGASEVRDTLTAMHEAAGDIAAELVSATFEFAAIVRDDAGKSRAAIALVLGQERISSELVDNLNASIHLRAFVTDLFLVSEARA